MGGPGPQGKKVLIENFYFWSPLSKYFKSHFERFIVCCSFPLGIVHCEKRLLVWSLYERIMKEFDRGRFLWESKQSFEDVSFWGFDFWGRVGG